MRANKIIADALGISRRKADYVIEHNKVVINGIHTHSGMSFEQVTGISINDKVQPLAPVKKPITIMLNKPIGYVCSREGQGSKTIYELLPTADLKTLNPIGRLDKDSSGLLLMTNDGQLLNQMAHPSQNKTKVYEITLEKPLKFDDFISITNRGVDIADKRLSLFDLTADLKNPSYFKENCKNWIGTLQEGRNRQIRRTFYSLKYDVIGLHRIKFSDYEIGDLKSGKFELSNQYFLKK